MARTARTARRWAPSRLLGQLWKRGATEATLLVTAAAVASGVVFGAGVARATSQTSDGQTWVSAADGTIVQINPVTGQPVSRVEIPLAGQVTVQQGSGLVVVTSPGSGKAVSIDVSRMTASRPRTVDPATRRVLLAPGGRTVIAELDTGVVRMVDPTTLVDTGEAWVGGGPFADVVVDRTATVWALGLDGTLTSLHWSDDARRFIVDGSREVDGVDAESRMVPHPRGVTVLSPSQSALEQVGTGADVSATVEGMDGDVAPADGSPRDLVAATVPSRKAVVILDGDRVWKADLSAAGCDEPGRPAVFGGRVYVPCAGQGRTLVLDRTGRPARDAIVTGDDDTPQIVGDDDSLVVTSSSADRTVTVDAEGRQHSATLDRSIPTVKPRRPDPAKAGGQATASTPPSVPSADPTTSDPSSASSESSSSEPSSAPDPSSELPPLPDPTTRPDPTTDLPSTRELPPSGSPSAPPSAPTTTRTAGTTTGEGAALDGPRSVSAEAIGPYVALVRWQAPERRPDRYLVRTVDGAGSTQVSGGSTSGSVVVSPRGSAQFVVVADFGADGRVQSQPSNVVTWGGATTPATTTSPTPPGPGPDCRRPHPNTGTCSTAATPTTPTSTVPTRPTTGSAVPSSSAPVTTVPTSAVPTSTAPPVTTPPATTPPTTPPTTSQPPVTSAPPPVTTSEPPPATTSEPPPATTSEPPPVTTSEPPPATTAAPQPPAAPTGFTAYGDNSSGSNTVYATWDQVAGVTYTLTYQLNSGTPVTVQNATSGAEKTYGPRVSGTVTLTLQAFANGMASETVTTTAELMPVDICNPLRSGPSWLQQLPANCCGGNQYPPQQCQIPLRGDTGWLQPDVATPIGTSGSDAALRWGIAGGLLLLAGLVHRGRRRMLAGAGATTDQPAHGSGR